MMIPVCVLRNNIKSICLNCHNLLMFVKHYYVLLYKWKCLLAYLRRPTTWSMSVIFNLSLTASISSAAVERTEHWEHGLEQGETGGTKRGVRRRTPSRQEILQVLTSSHSQHLWSPSHHCNSGHSRQPRVCSETLSLQQNCINKRTYMRLQKLACSRHYLASGEITMLI